MYQYKYPHPAVTTDCIIFGFDGSNMNILLIERKFEPCKGKWALPGGFLNIDETVEECAKRELQEETNIEDIYLEQLHVFSSVYRDPRERVLTVALFALVKKRVCNVIAGDDAEKVHWFAWNHLPQLAFDHAEIISMARKRLQDKIRTTSIAFKLLDNQFNMVELQQIYELIHERKYDSKYFRIKMEESQLLIKRQNGCNDIQLNEDFANKATNEANTKQNQYCYSFDEKAYNRAISSKVLQKYPFDF